MKLHFRIISSLIFLFSFIMLTSACNEENSDPDPPVEEEKEEGEGIAFYFGADLSYVNQVLDHGGVYKENNEVKDPYKIFADNGTNLARFRLWHDPAWTKEVYGGEGTQLYNDLSDVERSIARAKVNGMKVLLDFHYADTWADPGKQHIPSAWINITSIDVLRDSVYKYTLKIFQYLNSKNLTPEFVQLGNETNCGLLYTDAPEAFPSCNVCNGEWSNLGKVLNAGIQAVKDATADVPIKTKIILHVADPRNVDWWFSGIKNNALVTDFDIIGFSYYPLWHTSVKIGDISEKITEFKTKFSKEVMIMETAYPWTTAGDDNYNNLFGGNAPIVGYPYTEQGQLELMKKLTKEVKDGKGLGLVYWEPGWISSSMKDLWGTGSSWENCAFFDFDGNTLDVMTYAKLEY